MLLRRTVPERVRKGDAKSGFPPPIRALRRLQRVGLVMRTCGSGVNAGIGEGVGYGGWKLGDGIRGLAVREDVVCSWAEEGPACDAVSTVPPRREGRGVGG